MKNCFICKTQKSETEFYRDSSRLDGLANKCKSCDSVSRKQRIQKNFAQKAEYDKARRESNPESYAAYQTEYRSRNAESIKKQRASYRQKNADKISESNKAWRSANYEESRGRQNQYYQDNRDRIVSRNSRYRTDRRKSDTLVYLADTVRRRIAHAFARQGYTKRSKTNDLVGCDWLTLSAHIESQFKDGMSWGNRGEWHIDHIIPLASAASSDEMLPLFHYTNMQPLWAIENIRKGAKMPQIEQVPM